MHSTDSYKMGRDPGAGEGRSHNKVNLRPGFGCVTLSISFDHQGSSLLKAKDEEIGLNSL